MSRYRSQRITVALHGMALQNQWRQRQTLRVTLLGLLTWACGTLPAQGLLGSNPALPQIHAQALDWADYDQDGDADLLMAGHDSVGLPVIQLLRNDQTAFVPVTHPFHAWSMGCAAWGDLDGDGDPDLLQTGMKEGTPASGGGKGATALWRNDGLSGFTALACPLPGVRSGAVAWADLDGDGDKDCLVAGQNYDQGYISAVARNVSGVLQLVPSSLSGFCCGEFAVGDLTGDSLPDVALLGEDVEGNPLTSVWENAGGMRFVQTSAAIPPLRNGSLAIADVEGDGDGDLALMGLARPYVLGLWQTDSSGLLPIDSLQQDGVLNGSLRLADLDGDGLEDVVYGGDEYGGIAVVRTLRQFPAGTFTETQPGSPMAALHLPCIAVADWSGDGYLDMALSGIDGTGQPVSILYKWNNTLKIFEP